MLCSHRIGLSAFDSTNGSRKEGTRTIKELVNSPHGEVLTHCEPQMNMLQGGDGHLNQAVVLRIELNEVVGVEEDFTEA